MMHGTINIILSHQLHLKKQFDGITNNYSPCSSYSMIATVKNLRRFASSLSSRGPWLNPRVRQCRFYYGKNWHCDRFLTFITVRLTCSLNWFAWNLIFRDYRGWVLRAWWDRLLMWFMFNGWFEESLVWFYLFVNGR